MVLKPLNRGKSDNRYCGPAVISFLTGISTTDAAAAIRAHSGRTSVKGSYDHEVLAVLRSFGIEARRHLVGKPAPTLAGWLKRTVEERSAGRVFLVSAGHHYQLITGRRYACGRIGEIVSVRDERVKRRARVRVVYELTAPNGIARTSPLLAQAHAKRAHSRERVRSEAGARAYCKRLDAAGIISLDMSEWKPQYAHLTYSAIWVYPGPKVEALIPEGEDPADGNRSAGSWTEAAEVASLYERLAQVVKRLLTPPPSRRSFYARGQSRPRAEQRRREMKVALFRKAGVDYFSPMPVIEGDEKYYPGYSRISEWAEVEFTPRATEEVVGEQLDALDKVAESIRHEAAKKLAEVAEARARVLALTHQSEAA